MQLQTWDKKLAKIVMSNINAPKNQVRRGPQKTQGERIQNPRTQRRCGPGRKPLQQNMEKINEHKQINFNKHIKLNLQQAFLDQQNQALYWKILDIYHLKKICIIIMKQKCSCEVLERE